MDFVHHYTEEQQRFRQEVAAWLDLHLPEPVRRLGELAELDRATWVACKAFQRLLGEKGWLSPTDPVEWGGAGLTPDHALVIREELSHRGVGWLLQEKASLVRDALLRQGTEEQKQRYLPIMARGQATLWHLLIEPGVQVDPEGLGVRVSRDGDDYILDGEDRFVGQGLWPDYLWTLALADPEALPEHATATFLVPAGLEGLRISTSQELVSEEVHRVVFEHVRVPPVNLLGEEVEGWSFMQSMLTNLSGVEYPLEDNKDLSDLLEWARTTTRDGVPIGQEPFLQQLLMEAQVKSHVVRLFRIRNAWMVANGQPLTYELAQTALLEKQAALHLSLAVREVMGLYALLAPRDPRAPANGRLQRHQRLSLTQQNPSPGPEAQADAIASVLRLHEPSLQAPFMIPTPWTDATGAPRVVIAGASQGDDDAI
ncbi:MAG: acyl-CoA dehydrogenase [Dehalococcoidia bacterium]|nr:acyl-CoA dehydrogenase [Dehalococcoidia bacterium]